MYIHYMGICKCLVGILCVLYMLNCIILYIHVCVRVSQHTYTVLRTVCNYIKHISLVTLICWYIYSLLNRKIRKDQRIPDIFRQNPGSTKLGPGWPQKSGQPCDGDLTRFVGSLVNRNHDPICRSGTQLLDFKYVPENVFTNTSQKHTPNHP